MAQNSKVISNAVGLKLVGGAKPKADLVIILDNHEQKLLKNLEKNMEYFENPKILWLTGNLKLGDIAIGCLYETGNIIIKWLIERKTASDLKNTIVTASRKHTLDEFLVLNHPTARGAVLMEGCMWMLGKSRTTKTGEIYIPEKYEEEHGPKLKAFHSMLQKISKFVQLIHSVNQKGTLNICMQMALKLKQPAEVYRKQVREVNDFIMVSDTEAKPIKADYPMFRHVMIPFVHRKTQDKTWGEPFHFEYGFSCCFQKILLGTDGTNASPVKKVVFDPPIPEDELPEELLQNGKAQHCAAGIESIETPIRKPTPYDDLTEYLLFCKNNSVHFTDFHYEQLYKVGQYFLPIVNLSNKCVCLSSIFPGGTALTDSENMLGLVILHNMVFQPPTHLLSPWMDVADNALVRKKNWGELIRPYLPNDTEKDVEELLINQTKRLLAWWLV